MKVITNRHRNVALLVKQGRSYLHLLTLTSTGVETTRLTEDELTADWYELTTYPAARAVDRFTAWALERGITEGARKLLSEAEAELVDELLAA